MTISALCLAPPDTRLILKNQTGVSIQTALLFGVVTVGNQARIVPIPGGDFDSLGALTALDRDVYLGYTVGDVFYPDGEAGPAIDFKSWLKSEGLRITDVDRHPVPQVGVTLPQAKPAKTKAKT